MENNSLTSIQYKNVYLRSYTFPFRQFNAVVEDFHNKVKAAGIEMDGMFFYSLDAINRKSDEDADMTVTMYQPAKSYKKVDENELGFLDAMVYSGMSYKVLEGDFETQTERAYYELITEAKEKGMGIKGSFFHEFRVQTDSEGKKRAICIVKARMEPNSKEKKNG